MRDDLTRTLDASVGALSSQLRLRFADTDNSALGFVALATLRHLSRHGARTVTSLAASDKVTTQAVSARLKPLEEAGLVFRERDRDDARRTVVTPTAAGIAEVHEAERRANDALRAAVSQLSDKEREMLEQAVPILAMLAADLTGAEV
jgi:DNA-binding MarR family transcriptional regulator